MADTPEPFDELVTHARDTRVLVVGGGIAGLVAAWECAKVGMPVTVVEASGAFGGTISGAEVDGLNLDTGVTCWSAGGAVRELVEELGLGDRVVTPRTDRTWISGLGRGGAAAPVPEQAVLGIPANPWDESARAFIGWGGAWRAYLDRLRPPLTIGKEHNLARLVGTRMGDAVLARMVAPLSVGRYGLAPEQVDVAAAAPGLSSALTRTGSLGGAVADLLVDRGRGAAVESLDGGMGQLVAALVERLTDLGAELKVDTRVSQLERAGDRWIASIDAAEPVAADVMIVAVGPAAASSLLSPFVGDAVTQMTAAAGTREIVTLVVDAPPLDPAPRGAQIYPVPGTSRASGVVHETARWEWLARVAGAGRHVLHVAFDGPEASGRGDADAATVAREEASALLGVDLDAGAVRGSHRAVFPLPLPRSALGHDARAAAVRQAVAGHSGLAAVGAWLAGSSLANVVSATREEAERVRRAALWGGPTRGE
ncbi:MULTISPECIES: FAD-dependent oxidoreductase [Microbacterium]|uniref:protoporphyrinogen/coproporphyrinogen oxidase n=1 Tax=Microbacterium TaxID=33882 RepID=UPI00146DA203|nr:MULTISPECIES: FAD-dependent oxidoreductase [Microbacterium]